MTRLTFLLAFALGASACAAWTTVPRPQPGRAFRLELAGEYTVPRGTRVDGDLVVGGISGLVPERGTRTYLGISDNRDVGRAVRFEITGEGPSFTVRVTGAVRLGFGSAGPAAIDPEALALTGNDLLVASEGETQATPRVPPGILRFDRQGRFLETLPVPDRFVPTPTGPQASGVRRNEAFESLTVSPDGTRLFTGAETSPVQDGDVPSVAGGAPTRLLEYRRAGGAWVPAREFAYPLDAVDGAGLTPTFAINGLVELLAISQTDLLVLERSFAMEGQGGGQVNRIRLYRVSLAGARDVSQLPSLTGPDVPVLEKRPVLDLNDVSGLSAALEAGLDNFEGLAFGPRLSDGRPSLLMVSDDNFSDRQNTVFLLFRMVSR